MSRVIIGASEFVPLPANGRRFSATRQVRLGDVDAGGWLRLDAIARLLQDVATDDAAAAGLDGALGWVVRRTMTQVHRPAVIDEELTLTTWCSGIGRSWAERTTSLRGSRSASIDSVSIWVQVAMESSRPTPLADQFVEAYGEAAGGRRVSARLTLGGVVGPVERHRWVVRRTDIDPFDHVNNAANWAFLEEALGERPWRSGRAEMEFVTPVRHGEGVEMCVAQPGDRSLLSAVGSITRVWLTVDGAVRSAARWQQGP